jgi:hypothetical protein
LLPNHIDTLEEAHAKEYQLTINVGTPASQSAETVIRRRIVDSRSERYS